MEFRGINFGINSRKAFEFTNPALFTPCAISSSAKDLLNVQTPSTYTLKIEGANYCQFWTPIFASSHKKRVINVTLIKKCA